MFAEWARGDFTDTPGRFARDVYFKTAQPEGSFETTGPEGIAGWMREFLSMWDNYRIELQDLEQPAPGRFLAFGTQVGTGRISGVEVKHPAFIVLALSEGLITRFELFFERESALEALDRVPSSGD